VGGKGKDSYLQANGLNFSFVNEIKSPYDFTTTPVGSTSLLSPPGNGHGLYAFVKRAENVIRFVKGTSPLSVADSGHFLAPSNHMLAWVPNQGMVEHLPMLDPPKEFYIPEELRQKMNLNNLDMIRRDYEDVTDKIEKWIENLIESDKILELKSKYDRVKIGERLCSGSTEALSQLKPTEIGPAIIKEICPFISPFVVRKFESLGKGAVFLQSEAELQQWAMYKSADDTLNRQWVINYCSQKAIKKSNDSFYSLQDREQVLKTVSEYNPKTHVVVLLKCGKDCSTHVAPIFPSFDQCKKCGAVSSETDTLLINWDLQIRKFLTCEVTVEKEVSDVCVAVPQRKRK